MRSKERVWRAIRFEEVDRYPRGELLLDIAFLARLLQHSVPRDDLALLEAAELLGLDLVVIDASREDKRDRALGIVASLRSSDLFIFGMVKGPFSGASSLLGWAEMVTSIKREPQTFDAVARRVAETNTAWALLCLERGAEGIIIADDLAYARSTYLPPDILKESVFPHLGSMVEELKGTGAPVFLHSDGNLHEVMGNLIRLGIDGLQCLDPHSGMDYETLRAGPASVLCLMGDVDADLILGEHSPDEVEGRIKAALAASGPRIGYIFGTCCGIPGFADPEQVKALYRAANDG